VRISCFLSPINSLLGRSYEKKRGGRLHNSVTLLQWDLLQ
jgi:hypothetical protein